MTIMGIHAQSRAYQLLGVEAQVQKQWQHTPEGWPPSSFCFL